MKTKSLTKYKTRMGESSKAMDEFRQYENQYKLIYPAILKMIGKDVDNFKPMKELAKEV